MDYCFCISIGTRDHDGRRRSAAISRASCRSAISAWTAPHSCVSVHRVASLESEPREVVNAANAPGGLRDGLADRRHARRGEAAPAGVPEQERRSCC
jgi:hypothetical protein